MENAEIKSAIAAGRGRVERRTDMTREWWLRRMKAHATCADKRVAVDALKEIGKAQGWYSPEKTDGTLRVEWRPLADTPRTRASSDSTPPPPDGALPPAGDDGERP